MANFVTQTLEEAVQHWEEVMKLEYPLFQLPVERSPENPKSKQLWFFATDNQTIKAHLYKPEEIEKSLADVAIKIYQTAYNGQALPTTSGLLNAIFGDKSKEEEFLRTLSFHNAFSLLLHEVFHPRYCPDSDGKGGDKEKIYQALSDGIQKALPHTSTTDLVTKVRNVENAVWDFVIDTFQYNFLSQNSGLVKTLAQELSRSGHTIDSQAIDHFPEGVIPIFDVISYAKDAVIPKGVLSLNRYTYSLLFCQDLETRKKLLSYFHKKIEGGGINNIEQLVKASLKGLTAEINPLLLAEKKILSPQFHQAVEKIYAQRETPQYDNRYLIETITSLLMDKSTRYDAIKGFIQPLAHLIEVQNYEKRGGGKGGNGSGESGQPNSGNSQGGGQGNSNPTQQGLGQVVQSLISGMTPEEINQFLQQLASGQGNGGNPYSQQLSIMGMDEYYKRNAPKIPIKSPRDEAIALDEKQKVWVRDNTIRVPISQLHKYQRWIELGLRQNLPILAELPNQMYLITFYHQEEQPLPGYSFQKRGIDVARNWVLICDSSSSMGGGIPGCGSSWDALLHIDYGLLGTLHQASQEMGKEVDLWIANFSSSTQLAGPINLNTFYASTGGKEKETLLLPQCGGTTLNTGIFPVIEPKLAPGRTVWSFLTDGGISNQSEVYSTIERLTGKKDYGILFFDMFCHSGLGNNLNQLSQRRPNLQYHPVDNLKQILGSTLSVLVKYC